MPSRVSMPLHLCEVNLQPFYKQFHHDFCVPDEAFSPLEGILYDRLTNKKNRATKVSIALFIRRWGSMNYSTLSSSIGMYWSRNILTTSRLSKSTRTMSLMQSNSAVLRLQPIQVVGLYRNRRIVSCEMSTLHHLAVVSVKRSCFVGLALLCMDSRRVAAQKHRTPAKSPCCIGLVVVPSSKTCGCCIAGADRAWYVGSL